jgi:hypothetical protein
MGITSALIGGAGALAGMFGGNSASNVQLPPMFNMPNMPQAAGNAFSGIQNLDQYTQMGAAAMPYAQSTFQNLYNNPYAGTAQSGANFASGMGMNAAQGGYNTGAALTGAGVGTIPYAQSIMNTAMDPQQALYNQMFQQNTDQTRAAESARGILTTPYGAGLENQSNQNFNLGWQNNLLQREATGAGAAGGLLGMGANVANVGTGMMNAAPGQFATAAQMPYSTAQGIGGGQNQAIQSLLGLGGGAQGLANQQIQDYLNYIGAGNQAAGAANANAGLALQQQNQGFNQNMAYGNALGNSLYGLGRGFGSGGMSGSPLWAGGMSMF